MMKKIQIGKMKTRKTSKTIIAFILSGLLTGCTNYITENSTPSDKNHIPFETTETTTIDTPIIENEKNTESSESDKEAMKAAYLSILENFYFNHTLPSNENYASNYYPDISEDSFALYDINQDGKEELIILHETDIMAGKFAVIYGFDSETSTVIEELRNYLALIYYDNGVIETKWSHNQGLGGKFWPYTLYQFDQLTKTYINIGSVDAWDKSLSEKNGNGNLFPKDIDINGDGIVYYIMLDENELSTPVDLEEYNQWRNTYLGKAKQINIPFVNLTEENIYRYK